MSYFNHVFMFYLSGLIAGFFISSIICIGGSLCLKLRYNNVELDLQTADGEDQKTDSMVLETVESFGNESKDQLYNNSDKQRTDHAKCLTDTFDNINSLIHQEYAKFGNLSKDDFEWLKTMCIDNPLNPYRELYRHKLDKINAGKFVTSKDMETILRSAKKISYTGAIISLITFFIVVPAVALGQTVLDKAELTTWIKICQHWCLIATVIVVVIPPIQECIQICRRYRLNKDGKTPK